jgi:hypothetical protein
MKRIIIISLFGLLLAGCIPPQQVSTLSDAEKIATYVAATQTALAPISDQPKNPSQTPSTAPQEETPLPQVSATETHTQTQTQTETPTPTLTETITPTATTSPTLDAGDPVLSLGIPSFQDDFSGGANFYQYDGDQSSFQIADNKMTIIAKKAVNYETWTLAWGDLSNFYLEITGEFGPDCSGKDRYGMIFRAPDTSQGYLISMSCDGAFRLSMYESDDEDYTTLVNWTPSAIINKGPGGVNRLGIMANNSQLVGYINGQLVFDLTDTTFTEGRFGILVAADKTAGFTAYLTEAAYWNLP